MLETGGTTAYTREANEFLLVFLGLEMGNVIWQFGYRGGRDSGRCGNRCRNTR